MTTMMANRQLGHSGVSLPPMGMGCWAIGGPLWADGKPLGWGDVNDDESIEAIRHAIDQGIQLFDTADVYGAGHSERVLGRALAGRRDRVVVATKWGNRFDESRRELTGTDSSPRYLRRALEGSLTRLGTDYIDVYQLHVGVAPDAVDDMIEALEDLVAQGRIRMYGWSTDDPDNAAAFGRGAHCQVTQFELNVLNDAPLMLQTCQALRLAGIVRGPLAMGLLSGTYGPHSTLARDDVRGDEPSWMQYFRNGHPAIEWLARLDAVRDILTSGGRSTAQGALAWIWARSPVTIPIPGFRTLRQVAENVAALESDPLTPDQVAEIDRLLART
jgi:aryl-alcohol dehydrogenase-like predicted oxidoreductase